jgi:TatD DNase family protein
VGFIDTHVHLDDDRFDIDRDEIISSLYKEGVDAVVSCADSMPSSRRVIDLAAAYENVFATVGIHPHNAKNFIFDDIATLESMLSFGKVVAVGEIGLDYHYDFSPRDVQIYCMTEQVELARKNNMPIVFHVREAFGDFLDILRGGGVPHHSVMHSYSGSRETAKECMDNGMMISFTGVITFKNAHRIREVVQYVPLERMMVETDCPYMTPEPYRGRRNEPKHVAFVAQMVAEIKNVDIGAVMEHTRNNALKFFGIREAR